jgi:hypothetical protein
MQEPSPPRPAEEPPASHGTRGTCWYLAGGCLLAIALLLAFAFVGGSESRPITLTQMNHSQCELLASDEMLRSVSATAYGKNFDEVRQRLKLECKPGERSSSSMATGWKPTAWAGFLAHCAMHEDNPFSYCDNYFTTPGSRNETRSSPFFALSTLVFIAAAGFSAWKLLPVENDG